MNKSTLALCLVGMCLSIHAATLNSGPRLGLQTWTLRNMSFEQVVQFAASNHIRYLQFTSDHLDPNASRAQTLSKLALLKQNGIVPYTFGVNDTSADRDANRNLFEFARMIGAELIVVEPALGDWDGLEALVKEYDIKLAIHNHGRDSVYGDPAVVRRVLKDRDPRIGVCLDVGWITAAGFDAAQVFRDYQGRVFDVHFKDKQLVIQNGKTVAVDTRIGEGDVDFARLFAAMRESGWSGVMAIETDSEEFAASPQPFVTSAVSFFGKHAGPPADRANGSAGRSVLGRVN